MGDVANHQVTASIHWLSPAVDLQFPLPPISSIRLKRVKRLQSSLNFSPLILCRREIAENRTLRENCF